MSQDLLAAFGEPPAQVAQSGSSARNNNNNNAQPFSFFEDFNNSNSNPNTTALAPGKATHQTFLTSSATKITSHYRDDAAAQENEDDWGDFEGTAEEDEQQPKMIKPATTASAAAPPVPIASQFSRWLDEEDDGFPDYGERDARARKTGVKWDFTKPEPPAPQPQSQFRDPNVLFDADNESPDEEDDDDFGDFEGPSESMGMPSSGLDDLLGMDTAAPPQKHKTSTQVPKNTSSLLDLEDLTLGDESTNAWRTDSNQIPIHGFGTLGPATNASPPASFMSEKPSARGKKRTDSRLELPLERRKSPSTKQAAKPPGPAEDDEKWDDFEAWEQEGPVQATSPTAAQTPSLRSRRPSIPPALTSNTAESSLSSPPTNIPPPALILSLFPPLFTSAEPSFFRPLRQETPEVQQAIYADPGATTYLRGLLALATVCGRVVAGRKHRWKRDTILAQSMRIGPSAAGGVSGLKLTSIDRAENAKEEQEVADALRGWQAQVGKLKGTIAEVKRVTGKEGIGKVPELREAMPLRVAKEIEGGLRGNRACALCGLKREERVGKVDFEVEDSFGEWWVENVSMHRACRNFWEQHKESLRHR